MIKNTLQNILFVNKSINRQVPPIFYDWFTFSGNLHRYETCWSVNDHLNILIFWTQKHVALIYIHYIFTLLYIYCCFNIYIYRVSTIYSWKSIQNLLMNNFSLKNSTSKKIKYFLTKHFIDKY